MGFLKGSRIGELGTQVRLPDGRYATVVFNGLTGVGVKYGLHDPDPADFEGTCADLFEQEVPEHMECWLPDAMLREKEAEKYLDLPCICEETDVEVIRWGLHDYVEEIEEEVSGGEVNKETPEENKAKNSRKDFCINGVGKRSQKIR